MSEHSHDAPLSTTSQELTSQELTSQKLEDHRFPDVAPPGRRASRPLSVRVLFAFLFLALALIGSIVSVCALGRASYRWHGFEIELRLLPATRGRTSLVLTPLGEVQAHTHAAPVALVATLEEIKIDEIKSLVESSPKRDDLAHDFEQTAQQDLHNFVLRQLAFAALGALVAPFVFRARRFRLYLGSSLFGTLGVVLMLGNIFSTFNRNAFHSPIYTGTLKQAPWVIQFGKDAFTKIEALSQKLRTVAQNLDTLYGRISTPIGSLTQEDGPNTFRILHVSDIHNNPASVGFLHQVADQFKVKFIVDTGDLTDFGSPPETVMVNDIGKLPYPYVFVLGNHDSQAVASALMQQKNVTLLKGQLATVDGVTLMGLPNPASARAGAGSVDTTPTEIQAGGATLLQDVLSLAAPPDIVAIHDPEEARSLWGRVPLILCGHEHRYYIESEAGSVNPSPGVNPTAYKTVICNAGTTGAAGGRYLDKREGVPFSCAVLTFRRVPLTPAAVPTTVVPNGTPPAPTASPDKVVAAPPRQIEATPQPNSPAAQPPVGKPLTPAPTAPAVPTYPQLRSIDLIVLNGTMDQYSITHYTFNADARPIATP